MARSVGGHVSASGGIVNVVARAKEIKADCAQFFGGSPRTWARRLYNDNELSEYEKVHKQMSGPNFIHALYLVNLVATNEETINKSMEALKIDLLNSAYTNSQGVVIHVGSLIGQSWESIESDLLNRIEKLLSVTDKTQVILENSASLGDKIGTLNQLGIILNKINAEHLKICLDTAHLFGAGYNITQSSGREKVINELKDNKILNQISCIHLNESKAECGSGRDLHENLGYGKIGSNSLKMFINLPELTNLPLILEVPGDENSDTNGPNLEQISIAKSWANC